MCPSSWRVALVWHAPLQPAQGSADPGSRVALLAWWAGHLAVASYPGRCTRPRADRPCPGPAQEQPAAGRRGTQGAEGRASGLSTSLVPSDAVHLGVELSPCCRALGMIWWHATHPPLTGPAWGPLTDGPPASLGLSQGARTPGPLTCTGSWPRPKQDSAALGPFPPSPRQGWEGVLGACRVPLTSLRP